MTAWYLLSAPAWLCILVTAGARLADMGRDEWAPSDHVRRFGLIGLAVAAGVMVTMPAFGNPISALVSGSLALVWIAAKGELPWWDMVLGVHRFPEEWRQLGLRARLRLELRAIADSFRPRRYRKPLAGPVGPLP